jgi:hypothetical protein
MHDIVFDGSTSIELVAWAVPANQMNETLDYIRTLDNSTASYYATIGLTNDQMILERQFITLAQIYSSDRANAFFTHALTIIPELAPLGAANCSQGEVVVFDDPAYKFAPRYGACTNNTNQDIVSILNFNPVTRSTKVSYVSRQTVQTTNMLVADLSVLSDGVKLVQYLADGKLVAKPQRR